MLLFLYGYGVSLDLDHLRVGLVLEDTAPDAQSFAKSLTDSRYFDVKIATGSKGAYTMILTEGLFVGFSSFLLTFRFSKSPDDSCAHPGDCRRQRDQYRKLCAKLCARGFQNWLTQEADSEGFKRIPLINTQPRYWYNEQLESRFFILPGSLAIIMTLDWDSFDSACRCKRMGKGTMEASCRQRSASGTCVSKSDSLFCARNDLHGHLRIPLCCCFMDLPLRGSFLLLSLVSAAFLILRFRLGLMISTLI